MRGSYDAGDNGEVTFADFLKLADNFGSTDAAWEDGDFDGNGKVESTDFLILANNFGQFRPKLDVAVSTAEIAVTSLTQTRVLTSATDRVFDDFKEEPTRVEFLAPQCKRLAG